MNLDQAIAKVLRDLKQFELIKEDDEGLVRLHLQRLAVACWEEGKHGVKQYNNRQRAVEQFNMNGERLNEFISIAEAVRKTGEGKNVIGLSIKFGRLTKKRHIWKYKET